MPSRRSGGKIAVYVDSANLFRNGGYGMRYDVLREFACRGGADPVRLNAYVSYDEQRAQDDFEYREGQNGFYSILRDFGYKVIQKPVKWYIDESGNRFGKANADLDLAVDALLQSDDMDRVLLATGDGDFVRVVQALQNKGCRVEVVAFNNVSRELRHEADMFMSGYLIPNLLPMQNNTDRTWGELGSRVRGVCYYHNLNKGFGFIRYMKTIGPELWKIDSRQDGAPYETAFFHDSELPPHVNVERLPSRTMIFECEIQKADGRDGLRALDMQLMTETTGMRNPAAATPSPRAAAPLLNRVE